MRDLLRRVLEYCITVCHTTIYMHCEVNSLLWTEDHSKKIRRHKAVKVVGESRGKFKKNFTCMFLDYLTDTRFIWFIQVQRLLYFTLICDSVVLFTRYVKNTQRVMVIRLLSSSDCLQDGLFANVLAGTKLRWKMKNTQPKYPPNVFV